MSFKANVKEQKEVARKFGAIWTPMLYVATPEGEVLHEAIGWHSPADFITELTYGLARGALKARDFEKAGRLLRETAKNAAHDRAPEAMYWLGVSEYRRAGREAAVAAWKELAQGWPQSAFTNRVKWMLS